MKLAVIVPAHNAAPYVGQAIASLLRQRDAAQLDIIVVDDGSTDGTADIVAALAGEASEVRLIRTPNHGVSHARNVALDAVSPDADLLAMLDADDLSPAGRFARDIRFFDDPELDYLYGYTRAFMDVGPDPLEPDQHGPLLDLRGVQLGAGLMRVDLARRVGGFDEAIAQGEDTDYLFRMFDLQPRIALTDDICVYYRRHDSNVTNDKASVLGGLSRVLAARLKRGRQGGLTPIPTGFFASADKVSMATWTALFEQRSREL